MFHRDQGVSVELDAPLSISSCPLAFLPPNPSTYDRVATPQPSQLASGERDSVSFYPREEINSR